MASIVSGNQVKLSNGQTVTAQQGGWYEGQQFFNGTLSAKGAINSQSNQQGAGQAVSSAVVAQTNPNNVAFINQGQVQDHLNGLQNGIFGNYSDGPQIQTPSQIAADLQKSGLLPTGQAPTAPNLVDTYKQLQDQAGVDKIQAAITDFKAQQDEIAAQLRTNTAAEQGKPVAQNVIEGRVSEETRNSQEQYDFVSRQLSRKQDEMQAALGNIQTIMSLTQQDYQNASASYDRQFNQAVSVINLVRGIQQDQKTDQQRAIDNARANAQIFVNSITAGNLDVNSLPADQRANLNRMEAQAGLPIGFFSAIRKDPKADIIATNSSGGQIQVLMRNPDGSMNLQKYGTSTVASKPAYGFAPPAGASNSDQQAAADMWAQIAKLNPPKKK
jgi:hypothetical protein